MTSSIVLVLLKTSVALLVFGVGLAAPPGDTLYLVRNGRLFVRTLLSMHVIMPLAAVWLCTKLALNPAISIALIALAISPVPPFLPGKAAKAGGDASYTVGLVITTALLSVLIVPVSLSILGGFFHLPGNTPVRMVIAIVAETILLPMGLGLAIAHFVPRAARAGKPLTNIATILLLVALLPIVFRSWPIFRLLIGNGTLFAIVMLTGLGLAIGHLLGGPVPEHRTVLALATSTRHPAVAIVIGTTDFPGNGLIIGAVLLSLLVSAIACAPYVAWSHRRARERHRVPDTAAPGGLPAGGFHLGPSRSKEP